MIRRRLRPSEIAMKVGICTGILLVIAAVIMLISGAVPARNRDIFWWVVASDGAFLLLVWVWYAVAARRFRD